MNPQPLLSSHSAAPGIPFHTSNSAHSLFSAVDSPSYSMWNADTGASNHMTPHRHWIRNFTPCRIEIKLADGSSIYSQGRGTVLFEPIIDGQVWHPVEFSDVLYVPDLRSNLFSVLHLSLRKDFTITIEHDLMDFQRDGNTYFVAKVNSSTIAYLQGTTIPIPETANLSSSTTLPMDLELWHRRLCHPSFPVLRKMIRENLVTGLKITSPSKPDPICEPCLAGKMVADPFPSSSHQSTKLLELIHSDVHGPIRVASHSGFIYWVTFIDDSGRFRAVYLMKKKSETFSFFKKYKAWAENQTGSKIKILREDKGGEYMGRDMDDFCAEHGIQRQHSVRARPQQNGVAERANRTMEQGIISILHQAGLPLSFWGEALSTFIHIWNRTPTSAVPGKTPWETFYGKKPDLSMLRVWGCVAYVHIQRDKRVGGSLGSHMEKCIFIGYPPDYKGWKFYNPVTKKSVVSERAQFDERYFLGIKESIPTIIPTSLLENPPTPTTLTQRPSSPHLDVPPEGSDNGSDSEDMYDYGGDGVGPNPTHPHIQPLLAPAPPHIPPPPSPQARAWPADFPTWLSSTSPELPSSPQQRLSTPPYHGSPLGTPPRPPTPIPHPQTPILPLLQRRQTRNPPPANWRENQYKVKNAEQFRDKTKRSRDGSPSEPGPSNLQPHSPQPSSPQSPYLQPPPSSPLLVSPLQPSRSSPLPPQLSVSPVEISLSPPPDLPPLPSPEPSSSPGPSSPAIWHHRDPTPAVSSDEEEDSPAHASSSPEDDEAQDEEEEDSSDPNDDTYDPAADDTFYSTAYANISSITEPRTFKESQKCSESGQWREACMEELEAHSRNGTWKVVNLPPGKKVVGSKWIFKVKRNIDGSVERFKARFVAKGYSQRPGFDFTETFAPTVRYSAVRTILALAGLEDMEIHSLDISHAYLNGVLEEEIYMQLPEGFEDLGNPGDVLLLLKATYGLRQAGRVWSKTLEDTLTKMGFTHIKSDPSIHVFLRDTLRIIIPVFVDDMTIISKSNPAIQAFIKELSTHFRLRDLGPTTQLLGFKIDRNRPSRTISLKSSTSLICLRGMGCLTPNLSPLPCPLVPNSPHPWLLLLLKTSPS